MTIVGIPAEIGTKYQSNTNLERYVYSNVFGVAEEDEVHMGFYNKYYLMFSVHIGLYGFVRII